MDAEQTWPTEEELAEVKAQRKKIVKRVPKGTHEYQAAWIPDEDRGIEERGTPHLRVSSKIGKMFAATISLSRFYSPIYNRYPVRKRRRERGSRHALPYRDSQKLGRSLPKSTRRTIRVRPK